VLNQQLTQRCSPCYPCYLSIRGRGSKVLGIALAALVLAGCGSAQSPEGPSAQPPPADPPGLNHISNPGAPYRATLPRDEFLLQRLAEDGRAIGRILIMGRRGGSAFYRIDAECFATGPASPKAQTFSQISCTTQFPSAVHPILDFTVFHGPGTSDERPTTLIVSISAGFAANGVARVAFVDEAGDVVAETAVIDNTYIFDPAPPGENLRIAAFSATGERIFEQPKRASAASS
jgi:hypothetical protein